MAIPFQAFTAPGVVQGSVAAAGRLGELLEAEPALRLEGVSLAPLDGSPAQQMPLGEVQVDDLLFVIAPTDTSTPMHAAWHALDLVLGPYAIHAELPTLPGFDPARALARPGGQFVLLGRVRLSLAVAPAAGEADIAFGWVNRYAVDAVSADIDLALFFPGARITVLGIGQLAPN